jgi:hypothetical protein
MSKHPYLGFFFKPVFYKLPLSAATLQPIDAARGGGGGEVSFLCLSFLAVARDSA